MPDVFRYPYDIAEVLLPWREKLGDSFEDVVARLADRDRALEDAVTLGAFSVDGAGASSISVHNSADEADADGDFSVAIGYFPTATGTRSVAIGPDAGAHGDESVAIGNGADADPNAVAIGPQANAQDDAVGIGDGASASGLGSIAVGDATVASGQESVAVGAGANASSLDSTALGRDALTNAQRATATGAGATASGDSATADGYLAGASGLGGVAVGASANSNQAQNIAAGYNASATTGTQAIAVGGGVSTTAAARATAQGAIAVGSSNASGVSGARASAANAGALGSGDASTAGAQAIHANAWAIGKGTTTTATDQVNIGTKRAFLGAPDSAAADADLVNSQVTFHLDEGGDNLVAKTKWSDGTVHSYTTSSSGASGAAGGVLSGTYPNPGFAVDMATQAELDAHITDATAAHAASAISYNGGTGMSATDVEAAIDELATEKADTASAVMDGDTAGGVLSGTYPNPSFAVDMATQAELDAAVLAAETKFWMQVGV